MGGPDRGPLPAARGGDGPAAGRAAGPGALGGQLPIGVEDEGLSVQPQGGLPDPAAVPGPTPKSSAPAPRKILGEPKVKLSLGGTMRTKEGVAFITDGDGKTRTAKVGQSLGNGAKIESIRGWANRHPHEERETKDPEDGRESGTMNSITIAMAGALALGSTAPKKSPVVKKAPPTAAVAKAILPKVAFLGNRVRTVGQPSEASGTSRDPAPLSLPAMKAVRPCRPRRRR